MGSPVIDIPHGSPDDPTTCGYRNFVLRVGFYIYLFVVEFKLIPPNNTQLGADCQGK